MEQAVTDTGFVNVSGFGIVDFESLISAVFVGMMKKIAVEREDIVHQIERKFLYVFPASFPALKFLPGFQKIFD